eukprot:jgi/Astpho2/4141/Aster-01282
MAVKFVLLVNKQGQTRLAKYTDQSMTVEERRALEGEIVRRCLARAEKQVPVADQDIQQHQQQTDHQSLPLQCSFIEHRNYKVIYRRYASLFFLVGVDGEENELAILEMIHCLVETLDRYFSNVCELDLMFNLEMAHFIVDEMLMNGCLVETNKQNVLQPVQLLEKAAA